MFDRVSEAAEKLASTVSRRAFLGRLGQRTLALAGAMAGMLAFPGLVQANGCLCPNGGGCCCLYDCGLATKCPGGTNCRNCKPTYKGCNLICAGCCCYA